MPKFSRNLATLSCRIFTLHFLVSGLAKQNISPQDLCVKKLKINLKWQRTLNAMFERSNIAAKLCNCLGIFRLKKICSKKQNNFVVSFFILLKYCSSILASGNPFVSKEQKISRKFATSLDTLVAKGTNLVANATVLVAISSPAGYITIIIIII